MDSRVKMENLEEGEVSQLVNELPGVELAQSATPSMAVAPTPRSRSYLVDGRPPKRPKTQYMPFLIQPLNVRRPPHQPQLSRPKMEDYPIHVMPVSHLRPGTSQTQQFMDPRVEDYQGAVVPHRSQLLWPKNEKRTQPTPTRSSVPAAREAKSSSKNFWKAGDYEGKPSDPSESSSSDMDHVRVHPKFLHSNATSHKWAIGALAELLDNSMDEVNNGATFVDIDLLVNKKDGSKMLLVEDDGGGMDPNGLRQCMSLGFSVKGKLKNTIGQYGNGFKTSTMRLGADVIVFSRCAGKNGESHPTQSIGLLSYTFLTRAGKEDIVVPMIDYKREDGAEAWNKLTKSSAAAWDGNLETILQWSPYTSEDELLQQFSSIKDHGTRVVIYNLWEDDQGDLELDFDSDSSDIQVRGANRDEKKIQTAEKFPNSKHFLTYSHSLRSYASILYLKIPRGFRMILRGRDIEHHHIVDDMMLKEEVTYRSLAQPDAVASLSLGFVKDAKDHIDVQGFNVYHKNRLIKPFWRVWTAAGSGGRGIIGVLEANFVEPAHDKQGFERTTVLSRLESWLRDLQKRFWRKNSEKIGYAGSQRPKRLLIENGGVGGCPQTEGPAKDPCHSSSQSTATGAVNYANNRLKSMEESFQCELQRERERNRALCEQLEATKRKQEETNKYIEYSNHRFAGEKHQRYKDVEYLGKQLEATKRKLEETTKQLEYSNHRFAEEKRQIHKEVEHLGEQLEATKRKLEETNKQLENSNHRLAEEKRQRYDEVEYLGKQFNTANATVNMLLETMCPQSEMIIKQEL